MSPHASACGIRAKVSLSASIKTVGATRVAMPAPLVAAELKCVGVEAKK